MSKKLISRRIRIAGYCILLLVVAANAANGQTIFGRISGTVTDPNKAVLPNAQVTVTNEATNFARTVNTDENGYYVVTNLPAGTYTVAVQLAGFKKAVSSDNALVADGRLTVDVDLETGLISEAVEITASAVGETVNITSGEIARVVDQEQVQNLALNARNFHEPDSTHPRFHPTRRQSTRVDYQSQRERRAGHQWQSHEYH